MQIKAWLFSLAFKTCQDIIFLHGLVLSVLGNSDWVTGQSPHLLASQCKSGSLVGAVNELLVNYTWGTKSLDQIYGPLQGNAKEFKPPAFAFP